MMEFDGSTGYYNKTVTMPSVSESVFVARFRAASFTGGSLACIFKESDSAVNFGIYLVSSDFSTVGLRNKLIVIQEDSTNSRIAQIPSTSDLADGLEHVVFYSYDGGAGSAVLRVDGDDEIDAGNAWYTLTTGTMDSGSTNVGVGAVDTGGQYVDGEIGFIGYARDYLTNWSDFMDSNGNPIKQDEATWANSGWGSQPLFWNEHGAMEDNKGSAGNMTRNGTVTLTPEPVIETGFPITVLSNYNPATMKFDGSTGYYSGNYTASGNKVTIVARFNVPSFINATIPFMYLTEAVGGGHARVSISVAATDRIPADEAGKIRAISVNSSGTEICRVFSESIVTDGADHIVMFSFDADNGTAQLVVDGVVEDDTAVASRTAPNTGTLGTSSAELYVGDVSIGTRKLDGEIGFFGYDDQYLTNWSDFMDSNGNPIDQDESTWSNSGWGSQPLFWNEHGQMSNNQGSAGDMTENGTIVVAPESAI